MTNTVQTVHDIELRALMGSSNFTKNYSTALDALKKSGILIFLQKWGNCPAHVPNRDIQQAAMDAAHISGYQKCINDILYFTEIYQASKDASGNIRPTYGGLELMFQRGDISKEEYDKRKNK